MIDSQIWDNSSGHSVARALEVLFTDAARASILVPELSLSAFSELETVLRVPNPVRLLLSGSHAVSAEGIRLLGDRGDRGWRNTLKAPAVAEAFGAWVRDQVEVRMNQRPARHSLYGSGGGSNPGVLHGSAALTRPDLGLAAPDGPVMNTLVDGSQAQALLEWFERIWSDPNNTVEARDELLAVVHEIGQNVSAHAFYGTALQAMFAESMEDLDEDEIMNPRTGIKDTLVWNKLYRFQRDGVLGVIDKIERYNGCILADSVGLGKTFEALAVIKYFELRNDRVLVIAPKRLRDNWTVYTVNDRRNLFAEDRFNYDVLNHTDLTRTSGMSGEINLKTLNWGNYDLVVIDESHNFRNSPPDRGTGMTRYGRLMRDVIQRGVKTKVLMLSATPVNSRMNDLKNQIAFITEGRDDALWSHGVPSIEQTLRRAQARFNAWLSLDLDDRTTESLLDELDKDYFRILDLLTIARSRRHIEKYYDLNEVGDFPERLPPKNPRPDIDLRGEFPSLQEINREIRLLNLAAYAPLKYVRADRVEEYGKKYDLQLGGSSVFRQIDREESLIHLMRINLLKRMESSIHSFSTTVERQLEKVRALLERLERHEGADVEELSIADIDIDDDSLAPYMTGNKIKVLIKDVDQVKWKEQLHEDEGRLVGLLRASKAITAERDAKLDHLKEFITTKARAPFNPGNQKALVFTAFADTADYLYAHVSEWAGQKLGLHAAVLTGTGSGNRSTLGIGRDQSTILSAFSPISKERDAGSDDPAAPQIDILIATDCISEGQNLQDCDCVINYDIHWNPVRIIQRFGRIDRLGSRNRAIQLVNYWPNMELEEYINLEARVSGRMVLLDISATGEENLIEDLGPRQMRDLEYRRRQLEQLQDSVIDLEDLSSGISITDMTFSPYRLDLLERLRAGESCVAPLGVRGAVQLDLEDDTEGGGAIFLLRHERPAQLGDPVPDEHYLVRVSEDGSVAIAHDQPRKALEFLKRLAIGRTQPDRNGWHHYARQTEGETDLSHYRELLAVAVDRIVGEHQQRGVETLFQAGGTALSQTDARGLDDFEVVAWLALS
ncbi:helicase-related protein [Gemmatimonadota bacterium DH-20]|uniref:Helicase-related protein n=1 Tax=Gaopeijia maritima TaxID=3119007 RepID=A0ABU9EDA4_9BACT